MRALDTKDDHYVMREQRKVPFAWYGLLLYLTIPWLKRNGAFRLTTFVVVKSDAEATFA